MTEKKRILFVNDYLSGGGAEVVMHQLKEGLESSDPSWEARIFYAGETGRERSKTPFSYIYSFRYRRELTRILEEFRPEVVHLLNYYHLLTPSVLDALARWKKRNPALRIIYTAHDFHLLCPSSGLTGFSRRGELRRLPPERISGGAAGWKSLFARWDHRGRLFSLLKWFQWYPAYGFRRKERIFDLIVSPGEFMFRALKDAFPHIPGVLIRNPYVPLPETVFSFPPGKADQPVRAVFAGRLGQEKGLAEFIISAASRLGSGWELDVYGTGPEEERLRQLFREKSLEKNCRLKGPLSHQEVLEILPSYEVLVLPSLWYENAPLSLVEAAFNGLYLLVSDWGGVRETARFCGGAFYMDPCSEASVSRSLEKLSRAVRLEGSPGRNWEELKSAYSLSRFLEEHIRVYGDREA